MKSACFLILISSITAVFGQNEAVPIYPDTPRIINLWHRMADVSHHLQSVETCELSPDGQLAVSGGKFGYQVMLWRTSDGALLWENAHESEVECLVFSPDGKRIASGGEDYFLRVWDVATGKQLHAKELKESGLDGITWSPDGRTIVGGDEAGNAIFWSAETYREISRLNCGSTINSLAYSPDGRSLAVGGNIQTPDPDGPGGNRYTGFVKLIDAFSKTVVLDFGELAGSVKSVRWSSDGNLLAAGGFDKVLRIFKVAKREVHQIIQTSDKIEAVVFSPDGQFLIIGGHGLSIDFYSVKNWDLVYSLPTARTEYLDFSLNGRLLLSGHEDSGLLSLYLLQSDVQAKGNYQQIADEQLNNRDLKKH